MKGRKDGLNEGICYHTSPAYWDPLPLFLSVLNALGILTEEEKEDEPPIE